MTKCTIETSKDMDWNTSEGCVDELKALYEQFDRENGELIGFAIVKYGIDLFVGGATVKSVAICRKLRSANRLCTLESMSISRTNKKAIVKSSLNHAADNREVYFKNVKYNFDAHNKHILGHNDYNGVRGVWDHPSPENLVQKFGGKGHPKRGIPGQAGFKETVDFEEYVGVWKIEGGTLSLPTSRGTIHYVKKGAHILPAHPDSKHIKP